MIATQAMGRLFRAVLLRGRSYLELTRVLLTSAPGWAIGLLAAMTCVSALPALSSVATGAVVGAAQSAFRAGPDVSLRPLGIALAFFGAVFTLRALADGSTGVAAFFMQRGVDGLVRRRVVEATLAPPGIEHAESPEFAGNTYLATGAHGLTVGGGVMGLMEAYGRWVTRLAAGVVVARFSVLLAIVITATCPLVRLLITQANWKSISRRVENVNMRRRAAYLSEIASGAQAAKEIRIFGLERWAVDGAHMQALDYLGPELWELSWVHRRRDLAFLMRAATGVAGVAPVAAAAANGDISLGVMAAVVQAVVVIADSSWQGDHAMALEYIHQGLGALRSIEERSAAATARPAAAKGAPGAAEPGAPIRFEGVVFAYPGSERRVFDGLDFTIRADECTAIVGVNGAGKTTLVKLLAGLYMPLAGRVTAAEADLATVDLADWRRRLAVIFQDFVRYELSVADNIGLGAPDRLDDRHGLEEAARQAGCLDLIGRLDSGWDTILSRRYAGGTDLSGGQWQRVALARALFALHAGAAVVVLDEPTANLDVRAEAHMFERLMELTRGHTTVLVSHRFSTVRRADRICVLDGGRIVEDGAHDELMAAGGRYAEMFLLQAARFRDGDTQELLDA